MRRGSFDPQKSKRCFKNGNGLGQVGRPSDAGGGRNAREMAELTNAIQKFFIQNSRLGIPVIFHEECLHGHAAVDGTSFSQPIGLGATFDPDLVRRLYEMTAEEARSRGTHQALTPVVDVAREPRWGRVEETFGEDPYLVSCMGIAAVRGSRVTALSKMQNTSLPRSNISRHTASRNPALTVRRRTCPSAFCATFSSTRSDEPFSRAAP